MNRIAGVGVAALCLLLAGCRGGNRVEATPAQQEQPPQQVVPEDEPTEEGMRKKAPEPLLMEMWVTRPMTSPSGYRVLADGTWWNYRDFEYAKVVEPGSEKPRYREVRIEEGWWNSDCKLSPEELAKLKDAIRTAGVMSLPAETPPSPGGVIGGSDVYYTFEIDGKRHRIHYLSGGDQVPRPIAEVEELASKVIFNSSQRWLRDQGESHSPLVDF